MSSKLRSCDAASSECHMEAPARMALGRVTEADVHSDMSLAFWKQHVGTYLHEAQTGPRGFRDPGADMTVG